MRILNLSLFCLVAFCACSKNDEVAADVAPAEKQAAPLNEIAFYSIRGGHSNIFTIGVDGTNETQLTFGDTDEACPAWSPDGTEILYLSNVSGENDLFIMNADGSGARQITDTPYGESNPSWSPDGKQVICFTSEGEEQFIAIVDITSGETRKLTDGTSNLVRPTFSNDGKEILYSSDKPGWFEIYSMSVDGSNERRITESGGRKVFAQWSPDGRWILYSVADFENRRAGIYKFNPVSGETVEIRDLTNWDEDPRWSPDGRQIVYHGQNDKLFNIWIMDADGTNRKQLTTNEEGTSWPNAGNYWPDWRDISKTQ